MADAEKPKDPKAAAGAKTAAPAKGAAPAPAARPATPRVLPWTVRIEKRLTALSNAAQVLAVGLFSRDRWTRRMTLVFYLSCVGMVVVCTMGWKALNERKRLAGLLSGDSAQARSVGKFFEKQKDSVERREASMSLGSFTLELKPPEGRVPRGVVNLAEVELVAVCTTREACEYLRENIEVTRDQITSVFVYVDREELMTFSGKRRIKSQIIRKVNAVLPSGTVTEIYITKLLIS